MDVHGHRESLPGIISPIQFSGILRAPNLGCAKLCLVTGRGGNEFAEVMAAAGALENTVNITVPYADVKPHIRQHRKYGKHAGVNRQTTRYTY